MTTWTLLGSGWIAVAAVMLVLWFVQRWRRNAGIVDVAWAFGTGLLGVWYAFGSATGSPHRKFLVAAMAGLWGIRLGVFLIRRIAREEEDGRYQQLRAEWGDRIQRFLFVFFQIQAVWAVMFALPMWAAAVNPAPGWRWFDTVGLLFFVISLGGESLADQQLARFRREPSNRGKVCQTGLWRYSRHPNYFFEWLHWWAYVFLAWFAPYWWVAIAGPFVMLFFLFKVTGIPPTEKRALQSRGEAYRRYQQTTSVFFPWPPRAPQD